VLTRFKVTSQEKYKVFFFNTIALK